MNFNKRKLCEVQLFLKLQFIKSMLIYVRKKSIYYPLNIFYKSNVVDINTCTSQTLKAPYLGVQTFGTSK